MEYYKFVWSKQEFLVSFNLKSWCSWDIVLFKCAALLFFWLNLCFSLWGVFGFYNQYWKECLGSSTGNIFWKASSFCCILLFFGDNIVSMMNGLMYCQMIVGDGNIWQAWGGRGWTCFQGKWSLLYMRRPDLLYTFF